MSSPELTYDEVVDARLPAVCTTMADPDSPAGHELYREWRYENGRVWLVHRDASRVFSMRVALPQEIPWSGWHHQDRCDCRYCSGAEVGPGETPVSGPGRE
jgi:hypothetical protein